MQNFEYTGLWWLPEDPQNTIGGTLVFSHENGIRLKLIGAFPNPFDGERPIYFGTDERPEHPFILGLTDRKLITLHQCQEANYSFSAPGFFSQDYSAKVIYIGEHFTAENQLYFNRIVIEYSYLPDWYGISGFKYFFDEGDDKSVVRQGAEYVHPNEKIIMLPRAEMKIANRFIIWPGTHKAILNQTVYIEIVSQDKLTIYEWLKSYLGPIQDFLTLATDRPNQLDNLTLYTSKSDRSDDEAVENDQGLDEEEKIFPYLQLVYRDQEEPKKLFPKDVLFNFTDIAGNFDDVINKWMAGSDELRIVSNLFFGSRYRPGAYSESRFLTLAQAAEIYHRRRGRNNILPKSAHRKRIARILERTPKPYRVWLQNLLQRANEPYLKLRLSDLLTITEDIMVPLVQDISAFAQKVSDTRNYFTHYGSHLQAKAASGSELYWITEALSFMLQRCFLHELGFSSEQCVVLFKRNNKYQNARMNAVFSW